MKWSYFRFLSIFPFMMLNQIAIAQPSRNYFQNFEINSHRIILLHADGLLTAYHDQNGELINFNLPNGKVKLLIKDHNNNIIIVDSENNVQRLEPDNSWTTIFSYKQGEIFKAAFNSNNDCFLITNNGIVNTKNGLTYIPDKKLGNSEYSYRGGNPFEFKDHRIDYYMDSDGYLWVSFDHGEWGADSFIFNTTNNCFSSQKSTEIIPNYQINNQLIAIVIGYFSYTTILRFDQANQDKMLGNFKPKIIYKSESDTTFPDFRKTGKKLSLGGIAFNQNDKNYYLITAYGLFKMNPLSGIKQFGDLIPIREFTFPSNRIKSFEYYNNQKREFMFDQRFPEPPFISKIEFTENNKLVMLAPWDGLWLFDLKKLKILE